MKQHSRGGGQESQEHEKKAEHMPMWLPKEEVKKEPTHFYPPPWPGKPENILSIPLSLSLSLPLLLPLLVPFPFPLPLSLSLNTEGRVYHWKFSNWVVGPWAQGTLDYASPILLAFYFGSSDWTWALVLAKQVLYQLSYFPIPIKHSSRYRSCLNIYQQALDTTTKFLKNKLMY